ncbi:MAG: acyltransferase [Xanthobacteraceae bacterium]|nr:acyltransferase [Xanthobacteraceae bacterium]
MVERTYREDIDWLRAIAVLSVALFHWDVPPFRGGYVGVDIFFVISGFLITRIIEADAGRGEFSFATFYERRVRRLLPALYVMVALAVVPAFFYFLPEERVDLFKSIIATISFTSNFYFWSQSGYFGGDANEKPLLHTWSLSVEEQFYLLLPVVILLLFRWHADREGRRTTLLVGLGALALASFALTQWLMLTDRAETAFYFSPPRAWEFLAGSLIAIEGIPTSANIHIRRGARILGVVLIAIAVIGYRKNTVFPGISALLPCVGAVLFIWAGMGSAAPVRALLSPLNIASQIGKISYSFYLWHWPIYLYWYFSKQHFPLDRIEKLALFVITTVVSYLSYRFVEQPFRNRSLISRRTTVFAVAGAASLVLVLGSGVGIWQTDLSFNDPAMRLRAFSPYPAWYRAGLCLVEKWRDFSDRACLTPDPNKKNILVWGDSASAQYMLPLRQIFDPDKVNIMQATGAACRASLKPLPGETPVCIALREHLVEFLKSNTPDMVIISGVRLVEADDQGFKVMINSFLDIIKAMRSRDIPVLVIGPSLEYKGSLPVQLLRDRAAHITPRSADLVSAKLFERNDLVRQAIPKEDGVGFVSVVDSACHDGECPFLMSDGTPVTIDHVHMTTEAATVIGRPVAEAAKALLESRSK